MTGLLSQANRSRGGSGETPGELRSNRRGALALLAVLVGIALLAVLTDHVMYVVGAVGFLLALLISVQLHETGHFVLARRFGMKATQFFVGFGPTLWSRTRGETEYGVKAVPAGGYVKIAGMTPLEEMEPGDEDRAFYRQPVRQRVAVLAAGALVQFVLAVALVLVAVFALGLPVERAPAVGRVSACVADDPGVGQPDVAPAQVCDLPGARPAPAQAAGLQVGDVLLAVDGQPVDGSRALTQALRTSADRPVVLDVQRGEERLALPVTPAAVSRVDLEQVDKRVVAGTIGIVVRPRQDTERQGFVQSAEDSGQLLKAFVVGIKTTVTTKLGSVADLYSDERDPAGLVGIVGVGRISGEVLESEETVSVKAFTFLATIASLNLFVGLFNLLPLLPLDGGHVAVAVYEGARDKLRRLRGYRGPLQRVDYNKLLPVTYAVAGSFLLLTLFILGADLVNPIRLSS